MLWRLGRRIYMQARGEPQNNLPASSGEIYMQQSVARAMCGIENPVIFDVGANIGQWSLQFIDVILNQTTIDPTTLCHHAFEPVPATRAKLLESVAGTRPDYKINVHPFALSDRTGETYINILGSPTSGRNSIVDSLLPAEKAAERVTIELRTVDEVCAELGLKTINFLKIDAEGHDYSVILGAKRMLNGERIDAIQFEYTKRWIDSRCFLKDVFALVEGTPYIVARIRPNKLEAFDSWHAELDRFFAANYALVHKRALGWFRVTPGTFDASNTYA